MPVEERVRVLASAGWLSESDARTLLSSNPLPRDTADKMIENVVGVFGLPLGLALNFLINGRDYILPLAVEEPSIVAGLSGTAKLALSSGGFTFEPPQPLISGQVQLIGLSNAEDARAKVVAAREAILKEANASQPNMAARGGGTIDLQTATHIGPESGEPMLVVHLILDTRDAMGANLVNAVCEYVAPMLEALTGGRAVLRILSNLTDRAIAKASVRVTTAELEGRGMSGEAVRDAIVVANDLALEDPYRAATHNKGIMNGVDAIVVATGNDWRAIEAGAHAYAARDGRYRGLTRWYTHPSGDLAGEIELPVKVGTVGGSLESNPTVGIAHRLLGNPDASTLGGIIAVVGLAQNLAALRSLATNGIQQNHMRLHARSVASTAQVPAAQFDRVVERLIESGEIKVWKAEEILLELNSSTPAKRAPDGSGSAAGKIILLGEHAVVYGQPALAVPIEEAVTVTVFKEATRPAVISDAWGIDLALNDPSVPTTAALQTILSRYDLNPNLQFRVTPTIPLGMGLGASAALAVGMLRALDQAFSLGWTDDDVNALAFELEVAAHGSPSGVDNTLATFARPLFYQRSDGAPTFKDLSIGSPLHLVVAMTDGPGSTSDMVARVQARKTLPPFADAIEAIGRTSVLAEAAISSGNPELLGALMDVCHGHLNALGVSTPELEALTHAARGAGALGAKLTGGGGGGSVVALARDEDHQAALEAALAAAGYASRAVTVTSR